jgi:hypothetical protein
MASAAQQLARKRESSMVPSPGALETKPSTLTWTPSAMPRSAANCGL